MKKKIVVTQNMEFYPDQIERLKSLGDVTIYNDLPSSPEEWVERCKGADIVCSGKFGLKQKIYKIEDTFFSLPFVGVGWIDKEKLRERYITVSYSPGCNKDAVSEWIIAMMLTLLRRLPKVIRTKALSMVRDCRSYTGLTGKKVCILGKGKIGSRVGKICEAFDMRVTYFRKGDDLLGCVKDADIVMNCLSTNPTTIGILDRKFFDSLKKGSYFITITGPKVYDADALLEALDKGILVGAADDAAGVQAGDVNDPYYKKLLKHPKMLVTPHVAYQTDVTARISNDMMIDNVEAWIKGRPINLLK